MLDISGGESYSHIFYYFCVWQFMEFFLFSSLSLIFFHFNILTALPALGMQFNRKRKKRSEIEAEKEIITWTDEHKYDKIKFNIYRWKYGVRIPSPDPETGSDPDPQHWFHDRLG